MLRFIKLNPATIVWFGFIAVALGVINFIVEVAIIRPHNASWFECGMLLNTFGMFISVIAIVLGYSLQNFEE